MPLGNLGGMRIDTRGIVRAMAKRLELALTTRLDEVRDLIQGIDDGDLQSVEAAELLRHAHRKLDTQRTDRAPRPRQASA